MHMNVILLNGRSGELEIQTMKKEDIPFDAPFSITVKVNDYIQALVTYFDVEFSHCHKKIGFSTAPGSKLMYPHVPFCTKQY